VASVLNIQEEHRVDRYVALEEQNYQGDIFPLFLFYFSFYLFHICVLVSNLRQGQTTPINSALLGTIGSPCWDERTSELSKRSDLAPHSYENVPLQTSITGVTAVHSGAANIAGWWYHTQLISEESPMYTLSSQFKKNLTIVDLRFVSVFVCTRVCMCVYDYGVDFLELLSLAKKFHESSVLLFSGNVQTLKVWCQGHSFVLKSNTYKACLHIS
jgi:hypothetical protein